MISRPGKQLERIIRLFNSTLYYLTIVLFLILASSGCRGSSVTPREGSLSGRLISKTGTPVFNALVYWSLDKRRRARSDSNGKFFIEAVNFGSQIFVVEHPDFRLRGFRAAIYSGSNTNTGDIIVEAATFAYRDILVDEVSSTHAVISWKTTDYTNGIVEFGTTDNFGRTARETEGEYSKIHSVALTELMPNTRYYFRIVASRENRPSETSSTDSFYTSTSLQDLKPPQSPRGVATALTERQDQVTVFWRANTDADLKGYRIYRSENINARFEMIDKILIPRGQERFTDNKLITGKKYYYRVSALDQAGNESSPSEAVSMLVPGTITRNVTWLRANSPYFLSGDLVIGKTGTLRIDPGVVVEIADYDSFRTGVDNQVEITVNGALQIDASAELPVIFTSTKPIPAMNDWGGIKISGTSNPANILKNVVIAYADTGLSIDKSKVTLFNVNVIHSRKGFSISGTSNLTVSGGGAQYCTSGMTLNNNTNITIENMRFFHNTRAIDSSANDTAKFKGNRLLKYIDAGLFTAEKSGVTEIVDNLFVSSTGLGLHLSEPFAQITYNTFDSVYGIRIDSGNPVISKNIIISTLGSTGSGIKGIEHMVSQSPIPSFGPNNLWGFPEGRDYIGCASASGSLSERPFFMMEVNSDPYDYRLRQGLPDNIDPWGMRSANLVW